MKILYKGNNYEKITVKKGSGNSWLWGGNLEKIKKTTILWKETKTGPFIQNSYLR